MTLLNLHLFMIGITINCTAVSVIQHNLSITPAFENTGKENLLLPKPLNCKKTRSMKVIGKSLTIQPSEPVCNEIKQMITDASIHAANLCMKNLYKELIYRNYLLN